MSPVIVAGALWAAFAAGAVLGIAGAISGRQKALWAGILLTIPTTLLGMLSVGPFLAFVPVFLIPAAGAAALGGRRATRLLAGGLGVLLWAAFLYVMLSPFLFPR